VFGSLRGHEQELQGLVTNLNTTLGAFAAESDNLSESVRLLAPTLENAEPALRHTNAMLPALRAFARDLEPGVAELPATIAVSGPWLAQTRLLLGRNELRPLAKELRLSAAPAAAAAAAAPGLFSQIQLLSQCTSNVLIPTGNITIDDAFSTGVPNFKEFMYAATQFAEESQTFDGNGPYLRFQSGGGSFGSNNGLVASNQPGGGFENDVLFGRTFAEPLGTQPVTGPKPPFRTDIPCHLNAVPDINGPAGQPGPPSPAAIP
jgi:hypothetical protein